ncbi:MAG: V-type ATP synthase subunit F [Spirochaetes bacterium]|nr:V-type ATP synthase subunit F [Spirochaetota bacterium]
MSDIAILGEERNILGFKPFGIDVFFYHEEDAAPEEWFKEIVGKQYKLILVTDTVAERLKKEIDDLWEKELPVVLMISGLAAGGPAAGGEGTSRLAFEHLRRLVIKAIGTDLFKEDEGGTT